MAIPGGRRQLFLMVTTIVLLIGPGGCGSKNMYPVEGKILFGDGQPAIELAGGFVTFEPLDGGVTSARGQIKKDGTFRLGTQAAADGASVGHYRVLVTPPAVVIPESMPQPPPIIDARYRNPKTSGLEATVERKNNQISLTLERARGTITGAGPGPGGTLGSGGSSGTGGTGGNSATPRPGGGGAQVKPPS